MTRHDRSFHFRYCTSKTNQYAKRYPNFSLGFFEKVHLILTHTLVPCRSTKKFSRLLARSPRLLIGSRSDLEGSKHVHKMTLRDGGEVFGTVEVGATCCGVEAHRYFLAESCKC